MHVTVFSHSVVSDWNHGNAHFLRGVATDLLSRGSQVRIFEPAAGWSRTNLVAQCGPDAVKGFEAAFPELQTNMYDLKSLDVDAALGNTDVVLVHEWNEPELIARIGAHRLRSPGKYRLYFHDTHHRMATDPSAATSLDLTGFDGVLAYGSVIRDGYLSCGRAKCAWTWHEAADTRVFYPRGATSKAGDVVWIGNWGDGERAQELREFLIEPVARLGLTAAVYGVRYPEHALTELAAAGITYRGWVPNYRVPDLFARYRLTVHVPRRAYRGSLPGIPTIRPFEALACGIPLISAPWTDTELLFRPGEDLLFARNGTQMTEYMRMLLDTPQLSENLAASGLQTIRTRHTCAHRVDELMTIDRSCPSQEVM